MMPGVGEHIYVDKYDIGHCVVESVENDTMLVVDQYGTQHTINSNDIVENAPYLSFTCEECDGDMELHDRLEPGQAAVLKCENCGESWTIFQPSLEKHKTVDFEMIWPVIGQ